MMQKYFRQFPSRSCERTFANALLWSRHYSVTFAEIEHTLVFRTLSRGMESFTYPAGEAEDVKKAIDFLSVYTQERI